MHLRLSVCVIYNAGSEWMQIYITSLAINEDEDACWTAAGTTNRPTTKQLDLCELT